MEQILFLLLSVEVMLTAGVLWQLQRGRQPPPPRPVEFEQVPPPDKEPADPVDEGFENIMRFRAGPGGGAVC